jgi:hypothetical protein
LSRPSRASAGLADAAGIRSPETTIAADIRRLLAVDVRDVIRRAMAEEQS